MAESGNGAAEQPQQQQQQFAEEDCLELLECARYGELDDLRALLDYGIPVNFKNDEGTTALHRASANNQIECCQLLIERGAKHTENESGNTPLHWAVQNKALDVIRLLLKAFPDIDVLARNKFGKGSVSDAFNADDPEIIKILLEHKSAAALESNAPQETDEGAEEEGDGTQQEGEEGATEEGASEEGTSVEGAGSSTATETKSGGAAKSRVIQTVTHNMRFSEEGPVVKVREIGTDWTGDVFSKTGQEDTTGVQLWATSLVFARWIVQQKDVFEGKTVCELGAGCGLPGLAALVYTKAKEVVLSDVFAHTLENLKHNLAVNSDLVGSGRGSVATLDWMDKSTWPKDTRYDIILGCDLIYDIEFVPPLLEVVLAHLVPGGKLLYVSGGKRNGGKEFIQALRDGGLACKLHPVAPEFKANPLVDGTDDDLYMHFNELQDNTQLLFEFEFPRK